VDLPDIDLSSIADEKLRQLVASLLNLVQHQATVIDKLQAENTALRAEVARLKGQPPRPRFPDPPVKPDPSSEKERKAPKTHDKLPRGQRRERHIDRVEPCPVDRSQLPTDAVFKGYEETFVQDVVIRTDNVLFQREKFYSPSLGRTWLGPLPAGYDQGGFGPHLRAWLLVMHFASDTTQPKLLDWLRTVGIEMSAGTLATWLTSAHRLVEEELREAFCVALASCPWQHLDDTGTCLDGVPYFCHVLTSPLGTFFSTRPDKSRLTVLEVLRGEQENHFRLNELALEWLSDVDMAADVIKGLRPHASEQSFPQAEWATWLSERCPWLRGEVRRKVSEMAALADYRTQTEVPVVRMLVTDDAPQFRWVTEDHLLCWVHRGRHLKALRPQVVSFEREQQSALDAFWSLYRQVGQWQAHPTPEDRAALVVSFRALTQRTVVYDDLRAQLERMGEQQDGLLGALLRHPEVLRHNNPAELEARQRVRKRDVSFGPRSVAGARAWDVWQSVVRTTRTLGQNVYEWVLDRLKRKGEVQRLGEQMKQRAEELQLGWTWGLRPRPSG
jgi:hypothetical protein